jgi:DNA polymerase-3 subunit alpha
MSEVIPLFKSHYSLGRSILTLEKSGETAENFPDSIIDIVKNGKLKKFFLVDDNMSGFLQAYENSKEAGLDLVFGLRVSMCPDIEQKDDESKRETCKYIVLIKTLEGYKRLIKIYTKAAKEGFYYYPRIDFKNLNELWDDKDLELAIPFYDSFIFNNVMGSAFCIPDFNKITPVFFLEDNDLPFDNLVRRRVMQYCEDKYETVETKSVYYNNKEDFKAYLTFKCINNRSVLDKPQFDHMCSDEFCFESWKEKNGSI